MRQVAVSLVRATLPRSATSGPARRLETTRGCWSTATRVFCGRNAVAFGQYHSVRSVTQMVPGKPLDVYPNAVCAYNKYRLRARDFLRSAQMYTKSPTPMGGSGATVPPGLLDSSLCVWFVVLSKCCSAMSLWSDTGICSLVCWSR